MEFLNTQVNQLNGIVWGPPMLVLILGTGLFLMLRLKFMPLTKIGAGFKLMWQGRKKGDAESGEISPFQALMTCLAATVGTGNIAGVATAIFLGGPGALFWMWCTALVGMATRRRSQPSPGGALLAGRSLHFHRHGHGAAGPRRTADTGLFPGGRTPPECHWLCRVLGRGPSGPYRPAARAAAAG